MIISLFEESGEVKFKDITIDSKTGDTGGARGCAMADFDNDGWLDIYVNNGGLSNVLINDVIEGFPMFVQFYIAWEPAKNKLYRNNGNQTFTDVTLGSGAEGFGIGSGVSATDINEDGFADLLVTNRSYYSNGKLANIAQQNHLLINQGNKNSWIKILLEGTQSNANGYGAKVTVTIKDKKIFREHTSAHGYNSANGPELLFGLGKEELINRIEVQWPSGNRQILNNVKTRQLLKITENIS